MCLCVSILKDGSGIGCWFRVGGTIKRDERDQGGIVLV